jgi:monothiol glutaredoxin
MGIRNSIKKRLPIFGSGQSAPERTAATADPAPRAAAPQARPEPEPEPARADVPVSEFIEELVKTNKIVLFMKGSPAQPQCGFSANASAILRGYGKPLAHFDVLSDPEVRQGIKTYSQWPTIPQIYVNGEFLGGSDILMQMHQAGELKEVIDEAYAGA